MESEPARGSDERNGHEKPRPSTYLVLVDLLDHRRTGDLGLLGLGDLGCVEIRLAGSTNFRRRRRVSRRVFYDFFFWQSCEGDGLGPRQTLGSLEQGHTRLFRARTGLWLSTGHRTQNRLESFRGVGHRDICFDASRQCA